MCPIIDTGYERMSSTLKVFDSHARPPAPTECKWQKNIALRHWNKKQSVKIELLLTR